MFERKILYFDEVMAMFFKFLERNPASRMVAPCLALMVSTPALGGGLYITEFGQPSMGLSGAGWNVLAGRRQ